VRKLLKVADEVRVLIIGLGFTTIGFLVIGFATQPWMLYVGVALLALGSGLVNPSTTGLISLYAAPEEHLTDSRQGVNKKFPLSDLPRHSAYFRLGVTRTSTTPFEYPPIRPFV
jgi:hypothetical protein